MATGSTSGLTAKTERLAAAIQSEIALRKPTWTVTKSYYTNTNTVPQTNVYVSVTAGSSKVGIIEVCPVSASPSGLTDGLGLTQRVYVPDIIRVAVDSTMAVGDIFLLLAVALSKGTSVEYSDSNAGGSPLIADVDAPNGTTSVLRATYASLEWGYINQQ